MQVLNWTKIGAVCHGPAALVNVTLDNGRPLIENKSVSSFTNKEELLLGPYVGAETDHTVIPFGKGICGQVAVSNENFVVPDVAAQENYIACSITVKAEIVVPIFVNGENIGQIDIDSNTPDPFTEADVRFLEFVCAKVAEIL